MEAAYSQETKTNQYHHQTIKLATRQKIKSSDWKQAPDLQNHNDTYLDVWSGIIGLCQ
jgi:hypothetical protein